MSTASLTHPGGQSSAKIGERRLRTALIGCGAIAQQMHLPVLAGHPGFELVALVDRDRQRAEAMAKAYGVPSVLDDASELERTTIDAAVIATPPAFHADCAIDLMGKGVHVLVEKPIALTTAAAQRMAAVAEETGCSLLVGYFRRLFPSVRLLKALVDSEWAGRPLSFAVAGGGMYNWSAATLANMRKETAGGGVLMDFGTHLLDVLFAVFDEPAEVLEYRDNSRGGIEADCAIDLLVHHQGTPLKGRAEFARLRELGSFVRVECERATLEYQLSERHRVKVTPRGLTLADFRDGSLRDIGFDAGWIGQSTDEDWYASFAAEYDDWRDSIVANRPPILSGASVLPTMRLVDDCYARRKPLVESWVDGGLCSRPPMLHVGVGAKRVLVTGASGFVGCRVAEILRLSEGVEVRAVVNNPAHASRLARIDVELVQGNLGKNAIARSLFADCDAVIHCAVGTAYGQPRKIREVTVEGTRNLGEAALKAGVRRFVHLSSMAIYGADWEVPPVICESFGGRARKATNHYGWTKHLAERALLKLHRRGLPVVLLRPARVFGPFGGTFVINPLRAIVGGRFGWQGDPDSPCDMVYVDNVVAAALAAINADDAAAVGEAFNVSDGDEMTWREFYGAFATALGVDLENCSVAPLARPQSQSLLKKAVAWPAAWFHGTKQIVKSGEFKSLGRRVLQTDPIGTLPRTLLDRFPGLERMARKCVGADGSAPIYQPNSNTDDEPFRTGSQGARLNPQKAWEQLGYLPPLAKKESIALTLDWIRHSRILHS